MNEDIEQTLKTHYRARKLSESRVNAVLEFCEPARQVSRWKRRAYLGFGTAAAAVISLCVVIVSQAQTPSAPPLVQNQPVGADDERRERQGSDDEITLAELQQPERFQLIAVKIHADPCGRCKKIAPVFADLQNEFSDDPVLFLTFDLTSEGSRRQAEFLSRTFGIGKVFEKYRYTGVIVLVTPDGHIHEVVDSEAGLAVAMKVLSRHLGSG